MIIIRQLVLRSTWLLFVFVGLSALTLAGCGGGGEGLTDSVSSGKSTFPANLPNYHTFDEWLALIRVAGFSEYADLGAQLVSEGKVTVVMPPTLDASFNSYAWISQREIWINSPMFSRYPDIVHQATIFLHELIHIKSGESTHTGAWWSAQDQFATYWRNHPLPH